MPDVDIACFRQNYMEHKFFTDYMRSNGIAPQDILKHMLDNYISKGLFRYVVSNRTHTNLKSGDEKNIQLSLDYVLCCSILGDLHLVCDLGVAVNSISISNCHKR